MFTKLSALYYVSKKGSKEKSVFFHRFLGQKRVLKISCTLQHSPNNCTQWKSHEQQLAEAVRMFYCFWCKTSHVSFKRSCSYAPHFTEICLGTVLSGT